MLHKIHNIKILVVILPLNLCIKTQIFPPNIIKKINKKIN